MNTRLFILSLLSSQLLMVTPALAVTEPTPTPVDAITETLRERVQKVVEAETTQVMGTSTESPKTFGWIGTLEKSVGSTLQIKTYQGPTRIGELSPSARITRAGKVVSATEIELNSPVIVSGTIDQESTYRIERLRISDESIFPSPRQTQLGTLVSLTTRSLTMFSIGERSGAQVSIPISTRTTYFDILGQKIDKRVLKADQQVIAVLAVSTSATPSATRVYSLHTEPLTQ